MGKMWEKFTKEKIQSFEIQPIGVFKSTLVRYFLEPIPARFGLDLGIAGMDTQSIIFKIIDFFKLPTKVRKIIQSKKFSEG